jgi:hypothetical protein
MLQSRRQGLMQESVETSAFTLDDTTCDPAPAFVESVAALAGDVPVYPGHFTKEGPVFSETETTLEAFIRHGVEATTSAFHVVGVTARFYLSEAIIPLITTIKSMYAWVYRIDAYARKVGHPETSLFDVVNTLMVEYPDHRGTMTNDGKIPFLDTITSHRVSYGLDGVVHELVIDAMPPGAIARRIERDQIAVRQVYFQASVAREAISTALAKRLDQDPTWSKQASEKMRLAYLKRRYRLPDTFSAYSVLGAVAGY